MPDTPTFHVVRVPDVERRAAGKGPFAVVWPEPTTVEGERHLLVRLGDLPAPGEMGEKEGGGRRECRAVTVASNGTVKAMAASGRTLTRRAPPEPTWREDVETLEDYVSAIMGRSTADARAALARIEKRLAGGES